MQTGAHKIADETYHSRHAFYVVRVLCLSGSCSAYGRLIDGVFGRGRCSRIFSITKAHRKREFIVIPAFVVKTVPELLDVEVEMSPARGSNYLAQWNGTKKIALF